MSEADKKDLIIERLHAELDRVKGELQEANSKLDTIYEHQRTCDPTEREVWYWQGDGEDHPESMVNSLPVVIRAGELNALTERQRQPGLPDDFPSILLSLARIHQRYQFAKSDNPEKYAEMVWRELNDLFIDKVNDCDRDPVEILSEMVSSREIGQ